MADDIAQLTANAVAHAGFSSARGTEVTIDTAQLPPQLNMPAGKVVTSCVGGVVIERRGHAVFSGKLKLANEDKPTNAYPYYAPWNIQIAVDEISTYSTASATFLYIRSGHSHYIFVNGDLLLYIMDGERYMFHSFANGFAVFQCLLNGNFVQGFRTVSLTIEGAAAAFYCNDLILRDCDVHSAMLDACSDFMAGHGNNSLDNSNSSEDSAALVPISGRERLMVERAATILFRQENIWWMVCKMSVVLTRVEVASGMSRQHVCHQMGKTEKVLAVFDHRWTDDKCAILVVVIVGGKLMLLPYSLELDANNVGRIQRGAPVPIWCDGVAHTDYPIAFSETLEWATVERSISFFNQATREAGMLCIVNDVYSLTFTTYPHVSGEFKVGRMTPTNKGFVTSCWAKNGSWFGNFTWTVGRPKHTLEVHTFSDSQGGSVTWFDGNIAPFTFNTVEPMIGSTVVRALDSLCDEMNRKHAGLVKTSAEFAGYKQVSAATIKQIKDQLNSELLLHSAAKLEITALKAENEKLNTRIADMVVRLNATNDNAYAAGIQDAKEVLLRTQTDLNKASEEVVKLRRVNDQLKRELQNTKTKHGQDREFAVKYALDASRQAAKQAMDQAKAEHTAELVRVRAETVASLSKQEQEALAAKASLELMRSQMSILKAQFEAQRDSIAEKECAWATTKEETARELERLQSQLTVTRKRADTKEKEFAGLKEQACAQLKEQLQAELLAKDAEKEQLRAQLQTVTAELKTAVQSSDAAKTAQEQQHRQERQNYETRISHLQKAADKAKSEHQKELTSRLNEAKEAMAGRVRELEMMCRALEASQQDATKKAEGLQQHATQLQQQVTQLQQPQQQPQQPATQSTPSMATALLIDTLKSSHDTLIEQLRYCQEQLRNNQKQLEDGRADGRAAQSRINALEAEVKRLEAVIADNNSKFQGSIVYYQTCVQQLKDQLRVR